jgi:hypothetical protein
MALEETGIVIDYFHSSTPEHLEMMGVDPTRLPGRAVWGRGLEELYAQPLPERAHSVRRTIARRESRDL